MNCELVHPGDELNASKNWSQLGRASPDCALQIGSFILCGSEDDVNNDDDWGFCDD